MKALCLVTLFFLTSLSQASELAVSLSIPSSVAIINPRAVGYHDCSQKQNKWVEVAAFEVNSNSPTGFSLSAFFPNGFGWALNGTGSTQGKNFNRFKRAQLKSYDSANYEGSTRLNKMKAVWKPSTASKTQTLSNGTQKAPMTNWTMVLELKWDKASTLMDGFYSQVLSVTIAPN